MIKWINLKFQRLAQMISRWYNGTEVPYKNYGSLVFLMPLMEYHWTARITRSFVKWFSKNWALFLPILLAFLALVVAIVK
jgi:hypothetical protein